MKNHNHGERRKMEVETMHWLLYPLTLHLVFTMIFTEWISLHDNPYLIGSVAMWVSMIITYFVFKSFEKER